MISGLVVYLTNEATISKRAIAAIASEPSFEMGTQEELRLPLVLEAASSQQSQSLTDWLISLPGVQHVDVAFVHLEDTTADSTQHQLNECLNSSEQRV